MVVKDNLISKSFISLVLHACDEFFDDVSVFLLPEEVCFDDFTGLGDPKTGFLKVLVILVQELEELQKNALGK